VPPRLAFLTHPDCALHLTGPHPESPERLAAIERGLEESGLLPRLIQTSIEPATRQDLERAHDPAMVDTVERACHDAPSYLDPDTFVSEGSLRAALLAAGAGITAAKGILGGEYDRAFCAVRPPGHHAHSDHSAGFCLFNNIAVTAVHLLDARNLKRILIVDFDVHHGNGTQEIFYETDRVYYLSAHLIHHYPYTTGSPAEIGRGRGEGYNRNLAFQAGTSAHEYLEVVSAAVREIAQDYAPQFVLISAGFDSHEGDPLGGIGLRAEDFGTLTGTIVEAATSAAARGVISFLEGGYNLSALAASTIEHLKALLGENRC
jgi:acetoin utilization deacetylase AcuC-like enzyme